MSPIDGVGQDPPTAAAGGAPAGFHEPRRALRIALWLVITTAVVISWWIAATPTVCAAGGGANVTYDPCPSASDRTAAAAAVTAGYAVLPLVARLHCRARGPLMRSRSRPLAVAVLVVAAAAAVPAWFWIGQPVW